MESQPQNPELWNNPENFHPCKHVHVFTRRVETVDQDQLVAQRPADLDQQ